jgi:hypothetical protein
MIPEDPTEVLVMETWHVPLPSVVQYVGLNETGTPLVTAKSTR